VASGRMALLYWRPDGSYQVVVVSCRSGTVLQTYPPGTLADEVYDQLHYDGTDFWIRSWRYQQSPAAFYPIKRFDPATMAFTMVHRIPIENPRLFAWDPPYAWIEEHGSSSSLVKVQLEGF
jgi:hypothetical protein